jgi:hypothetical protein
VFKVADSAILNGMTLLIIDMLFISGRQKVPEPESIEASGEATAASQTEEPNHQI